MMKGVYSHCSNVDTTCASTALFRLHKNLKRCIVWENNWGAYIQDHTHKQTIIVCVSDYGCECERYKYGYCNTLFSCKKLCKVIQVIKIVTAINQQYKILSLAISSRLVLSERITRWPASLKIQNTNVHRSVLLPLQWIECHTLQSHF